MLGRDGGADHHAIQPQIPWQCLGSETRDALAHQRPPGDRGRDGGEDGVAREAPTLRFEEFQEQRLPATRMHRRQHGFGAGIVRLFW